jgi:xeroderma pigmentosum group C-complementing protein
MSNDHRLTACSQTGFEFHKRRAIPVVNGIIIAEENKAMLMEAYYASETMAVEKEMQKRKERCLKRWKKLIIGLRLRSRLQGEYKPGKGEKPAGAANTNGSMQEGVSQFQALPADDEVKHVAAAPNAQPPDPSATQNGFIHLDSLDTSIPSGAAFPAITSTSPRADDPKVDVTSLNLPPMPAPAPAPKQVYKEVDFDEKVDVPRGMVQGGSSMDLDGFTLAAPDEIAEGGEDIHSADEAEVGGGFMREEDAEAEKHFKAKDFAQTNGNDASDTDVDAVAPTPARRRGRAGKTAAPPASEGEDEQSESEDEDDGEADYSEPARPTRSSVVRTRNTRSRKKQESDEEDDEHESVRRSTRRSAAKPVNGSSPSSTGRATRRQQAQTKQAAVEPMTSSRPTRAAARKAAQANVVDLASDTDSGDA